MQFNDHGVRKNVNLHNAHYLHGFLYVFNFWVNAKIYVFSVPTFVVYVGNKDAVNDRQMRIQNFVLFFESQKFPFL